MTTNMAMWDASLTINLMLSYYQNDFLTACIIYTDHEHSILTQYHNLIKAWQQYYVTKELNHGSSTCITHCSNENIIQATNAERCNMTETFKYQFVTYLTCKNKEINYTHRIKNGCNFKRKYDSISLSFMKSSISQKHSTPKRF